MKRATQKALNADVDRLKKLSGLTEGEQRPYICVHAKKGKHECKAESSYQAAKKAAEHWGLKSTAGIDAHLADKEKVAEGRLGFKDLEKFGSEMASRIDIEARRQGSADMEPGKADQLRYEIAKRMGLVEAERDTHCSDKCCVRDEKIEDCECPHRLSTRL